MIDRNDEERKARWLRAENRRRDLSQLPPIFEVPERYLTPMNSEDEMEAALESAASRTGNSDEVGQIEFNLVDKVEPTTLQNEIYILLGDLMNRLELMGENLIVYFDLETGDMELSGDSHTVKYDSLSERWVIIPGPTVV